MEMIQIQKEIGEILCCRKWMPNDTLEAYLEYAAMYSKKYWLLLHDEYLRRMENEIIIS